MRGRESLCAPGPILYFCYIARCVHFFPSLSLSLFCYPWFPLFREQRAFYINGIVINSATFSCFFFVLASLRSPTRGTRAPQLNGSLKVLREFYIAFFTARACGCVINLRACVNCVIVALGSLIFKYARVTLIKVALHVLAYVQNVHN